MSEIARSPNGCFGAFMWENVQKSGRVVGKKSRFFVSARPKISARVRHTMTGRVRGPFVPSGTVSGGRNPDENRA
jgi:hypothetical protein